MNYIVIAVAAFIWLLVAFVVVIRIKKKTDGTKYEKLVNVLFVYPFVACDWLFNITVFTVFFLDLPGSWNEVVTKRMKRYKLIKGGNRIELFRYKFSVKLCDFLSEHDMGHC